MSLRHSFGGGLLLLFVLMHNLTFAAAAATGEPRRIEATGGGVAPLNSSMELKYLTGQEKWDVCYWYRFKGEGKEEHCMFIAAGDTSKPTCSNEALASVMRYTGTVASECTISIDHLTEDDDCGWEVRVDAQRTNRQINVTVALPVTSLELTSDPASPLTAGQDVTIDCKATGGKPVPTLNLVSGPSSFKDTAPVESTVDSVKSSKLQVVPTWKDHGVTINCTAHQVDGNNGPLFEDEEHLSKSLVLTVNYPPQPMYGDVDETAPVVRTNLQVSEGGNLTVRAVVKANPNPTYFKWTMTYYHDSVTNDTKDSVELSKGNDGYTLFESATEPLVHELRVGILNASLAFWNGTLQLETENSLGKQTYFFDIKVIAKDDGGDGNNGGDGDSGSGGGLSGGVVAIIVIVAVLALLIGSIFIYKKMYARSNETTPLR